MELLRKGDHSHTISTISCLTHRGRNHLCSLVVLQIPPVPSLVGVWLQAIISSSTTIQTCLLVGCQSPTRCIFCPHAVPVTLTSGNNVYVRSVLHVCKAQSENELSVPPGCTASRVWQYQEYQRTSLWAHTTQRCKDGWDAQTQSGKELKARLRGTTVTRGDGFTESSADTHQGPRSLKCHCWWQPCKYNARHYILHDCHQLQHVNRLSETQAMATTILSSTNLHVLSESNSLLLVWSESTGDNSEGFFLLQSLLPNFRDSLFPIGTCLN